MLDCGNCFNEPDRNSTGQRTERSVSVPSAIKVNGKKYKINAVGSYALEESAKKELTSVTLSSGITSIGKESFKGAGKLKTIFICGNLTSVGKDAVAGINKKLYLKLKHQRRTMIKSLRELRNPACQRL